MSSCADSYLVDECPPPPGPGAAGDAATAKEEYDFIEQPSREYFCPVTFELLLHPDQTTCCGHHISREVVVRIQKDKKPCPMCKEPLTTVPDKFFRRKVHELKVRCSHKKNGCEWVGDLGSYDDHVKKCPKRPWQCEFCDFKSTYDIVNEHHPNCEKRPVPCPNACEIGTVPLADVESHLLECPLQLVACELAHTGCNAQVTRRELPQHMKESVQQHLLSASLLNLQLTRDKIERQDEELKKKDEQLRKKDDELKKKDEQLKKKDDYLKKKDEQLKKKDEQLKRKDDELKKKDEQLKKKDDQLKKKDDQLAVKDEQLQKAEREYIKILGEKDRQTSELQKRIGDSVVSLQQQLTKHAQTTEAIFNKQDCNNSDVRLALGFQKLEYIISEFDRRKKQYYNWYSGVFYLHSYCFELSVDVSSDGETHANLHLRKGDNDRRLPWPVEVEVYLQLLNQLGDHTHHSVTTKLVWKQDYTYNRISNPFLSYAELQHNAAKNTQYLKDDCLKLRLYIKATAKT